MMPRPLLWRLGLLGSGVLITALMWAGGLFSSKKAIVIDYSMLGDDARGAEVFIDDESVGVLEVLLPTYRTGFEVSEGAHVIRVEHPWFGSEPIRVETQGSQSAVLLHLDVAEWVDPSTTDSRQRLVLRR